MNGKQSRFVIGLVIALIVVIFAVLNVNPVTVSFGFTRVKLPLIILIIVTLLLGAIITMLLASTGKKKNDDLSRHAQKQISKVKVSNDKQIADALKENNVKKQTK
ncbi:lipopolysaccharide assembly protein LapA domain-containing protein [Companilactobacillus musae]|uniref:lipopolysaccharide assembly protein LapA domain-containing protein n=1 Tax=Companilactobacillus musae TaxID=1903258 RepID=UPI000E6514A5|nr:lipopolysaccharide assembly protein LapA domain-containing protein [Companilactobacillus musae]